MLGVDLLAIPTIGVETALSVAAEVGADLSRFPSVKDFCSWLALAPGTCISGDKRLKGKQRRRSNEGTPLWRPALEFIHIPGTTRPYGRGRTYILLTYPFGWLS